MCPFDDVIVCSLLKTAPKNYNDAHDDNKSFNNNIEDVSEDESVRSLWISDVGDWQWLWWIEYGCNV